MFSRNAYVFVHRRFWIYCIITFLFSFFSLSVILRPIMNGVYELMIIVSVAQSETEEKKLMEGIAKALGSGGKVVSNALFGKKKLAYPVKKEQEAKYYLLELKTLPSNIKNIQSKLDSTPTVLRYLIIRKE